VVRDAAKGANEETEPSLVRGFVLSRA